MNLHLIVEKLNKFAPTKYAESWDNVGLLIEPPNLNVVKSVLLTNDLTLQVMKEAEEKKCEMIISYHPPIFTPLKKITLSNWKERIVGQCLASGIALYSPHTAWDAVKGGVTDWLIEPFSGIITPVEETRLAGKFSYKLTFMSSAGRSRIEDCFKEEVETGIARFEENDCIFSFLCTSSAMVSLVKKIEDNQDICQDGSLNINKLEKIPITGSGSGRTSILATPITLADAIEKVKKHTGICHVRVAIHNGGSLDSEIKSVSVCAGAGFSVLSNVNSDLIVTGEMSHHQVLDFTQRGVTVILTEHSNCERGFLTVFKGKLEKMLDGNVDIHIAQTDEDPLCVK